MIASALLIWAMQARAVSPVADQVTEVPPISAVSWRCSASTADGQVPIKLSGSFPAMSPAGQKNGSAFRVTTNVESSDRQFAGSFQAILTSGVPMLTNYSIQIPRRIGPAAFVVRLEFFPAAHNGVVNIVQFDPSGEPSAYGSGLCATQVGQ